MNISSHEGTLKDNLTAADYQIKMSTTPLALMHA